MLHVLPAGQWSMLFSLATERSSAVGPVAIGALAGAHAIHQRRALVAAVGRGGRPVPGPDVPLHRPHAAGIAPVARVHVLPAEIGVHGVDPVGQLVHLGDVVAKARRAVGQHLAQRLVPLEIVQQRLAQLGPGELAAPRTRSGGWPSARRRRCWGR